MQDSVAPLIEQKQKELEINGVARVIWYAGGMMIGAAGTMSATAVAAAAALAAMVWRGSIECRVWMVKESSSFIEQKR